MQLFLTPHSCWDAIFAPHRLATVSEGDDLGLGPGIHFTFGDIAMFEAVNQVRVYVCARVHLGNSDVDLPPDATSPAMHSRSRASDGDFF